MFLFSKGETLPRSSLDHVPIVLNGKKSKSYLRPFGFENMWLKHPGFLELIRGWWIHFHVNDKPGQQLRLIPKFLQENLRRGGTRRFLGVLKIRGRVFWMSYVGGLQ